MSDSDEKFFKELSELISSDRASARERLISKIATNPGDLRSRLLLAKTFFLDGMMEFSLRELLEIRRRRDTPSIQALIASFGPLSSQYAVQAEPQDDRTVSEIDFDLSILDEINE